MAEIDYGTIIKKNGEINTSTCGIPEELFGDEQLRVELHRWGARFVYSNNNKPETLNWVANDCFGPYSYARYSWHFNVNGVRVDVRRMHCAGRFKMRFFVNNDLYEFIWGYGVDPDINAWYDLSAGEKNYLLSHGWIQEKKYG